MHGDGNLMSNCPDDLGVMSQRLGLLRVVYDPQALDDGVNRIITKIAL